MMFHVKHFRSTYLGLYIVRRYKRINRMVKIKKKYYKKKNKFVPRKKGKFIDLKIHK